MKPLKVSQAAAAVMLALAAGAAGAVPGYATDSNSSNIVSGSGLCWRTGDWTPDKAAAPCDAVPRAAVPAPAIVQQQQPAFAPLAAPAAPATWSSSASGTRVRASRPSTPAAARPG